MCRIRAGGSAAQARGLGGQLLGLFCASEGRAFQAMDGVHGGGKSWAEKLMAVGRLVHSEFGKTWMQDVDEVADKLQGWCPEWRESKDKLMEKESIA